MQHGKIKEDYYEWTFGLFFFPLHAATIFNLPNSISMDIGGFCFSFFSPTQVTFQAVQQMPVILEIQIAGESLFSVSLVFQELFAIK